MDGRNLLPGVLHVPAADQRPSGGDQDLLLLITEILRRRFSWLMSQAQFQWGLETVRLSGFSRTSLSLLRDFARFTHQAITYALENHPGVSNSGRDENAANERNLDQTFQFKSNPGFRNIRPSG